MDQLKAGRLRWQAHYIITQADGVGSYNLPDNVGTLKAERYDWYSIWVNGQKVWSGNYRDTVMELSTKYLTIGEE